MVGINKPTVHFYTNSIILYESHEITNLVNLSERLELEKRIGWEGIEVGKSPGSESVLVLIDNDTSNLYHWKILDPVELGRFGIYYLWKGILWMKYVIFISSILMTLVFFSSSLIILYQSILSKK